MNILFWKLFIKYRTNITIINHKKCIYQLPLRCKKLCPACLICNVTPHTGWLWCHRGECGGAWASGCAAARAVPREDALGGGKDPGLAARLDGAGEERGREQVPLGRVCATAGLLQELPRHDVSRGTRRLSPRPPFPPFPLSARVRLFQCVFLFARTSAY